MLIRYTSTFRARSGRKLCREWKAVGPLRTRADYPRREASRDEGQQQPSILCARFGSNQCRVTLLLPEVAFDEFLNILSALVSSLNGRHFKVSCVMNVLRCVIASTAMFLTGSGVYAQSIDDDTACGAIVKIIDVPSPDKQKVKEVLDYSLEIMKAVDRLHQLRGQIQIFPQMSMGGRTSVALMVAERCRGREAITLADTAIETYEAIRSMRIILGVNGERRKPARRSISRPRFVPASFAYRQATRPTVRRAEEDR
jgi:hypothetical protein